MFSLFLSSHLGHHFALRMTEGNLKLEISCPAGQLEIFAPLSTWLKMTEWTFQSEKN